MAPSAPLSPHLDDGIASLPLPLPTYSFSEKEALTLHEARRDTVSAVLQYSDDPFTKFAQMPGDGGLIKGVLAHVAALAGVPCWVKKAK